VAPTKLTEAQIAAALPQLPEWTRDEQWLVRRFRFTDYLTGIAFVSQVAHASEARNHHPLIAIDYKNITVKWTTWHAGGLTVQDVESAQLTDAAFASLMRV